MNFDIVETEKHGKPFDFFSDLQLSEMLPGSQVRKAEFLSEPLQRREGTVHGSGLLVSSPNCASQTLSLYPG